MNRDDRKWLDVAKFDRFRQRKKRQGKWAPIECALRAVPLCSPSASGSASGSA